MLRHILVPLDGLPVSQAALPPAAWLAEKAPARVTLLHMVERDAPASLHGQPHLVDAAAAERYLRDVAARSFARTVRVEWHVHEGGIDDVAESLAAHVEELKPDLVAMLAHGRPNLRQRVLGSLAQQLVGRGRAAVLLVRPGADGQVALPFRQLLVPLDGQAAHESALPLAAQIARLASAPVHLLTVVPRWADLSGPRAATSQLLPAATREMLDLAEQRGVDYLAAVSTRLQREGICSSAAVARGRPARLIAQTANQRGADLVAMATHGQAGTRAFWSGSLGARLVGRIEASFLLVPAGKEQAGIQGMRGI